MTADGMILVKAAGVLALLLLVLGMLGGGWLTRWLFGMALGACLVAGALWLLLAIL